MHERLKTKNHYTHIGIRRVRKIKRSCETKLPPTTIVGMATKLPCSTLIMNTSAEKKFTFLKNYNPYTSSAAFPHPHWCRVYSKICRIWPNFRVRCTKYSSLKRLES